MCCLFVTVPHAIALQHWLTSSNYMTHFPDRLNLWVPYIWCNGMTEKHTQWSTVYGESISGITEQFVILTVKIYDSPALFLCAFCKMITVFVLVNTLNGLEHLILFVCICLFCFTLCSVLNRRNVCALTGTTALAVQSTRRCINKMQPLANWAPFDWCACKFVDEGVSWREFQTVRQIVASANSQVNKPIPLFYWRALKQQNHPS